MSDRHSATIRAVPFTELFRGCASTAALAQGIEARIAAAEQKAFIAGQTAARAELAETLAAEAAAQERARKAIETRHAEQEASRNAANTQALQAIEAAYADSLAPIAIAIARTVTAAEPAISAATLQSLLREVLAALPEDAAGTLLVPPGSVHPDPPAGWRIAEDATLASGGLRARVDASVVTASLERRFAQMEGRLG
ncbi:MAG: hypothetical protein KGZ61_05290 [Sandarakinorhabdus sp.]|nr:hypothetical protein [Sandarakinorhabdus sp.]